jgi:hypothetical protein
MAAPVNYSTQIAATKTVGEMQQMLAAAGAQRIAVDYEGGSPTGLTFALDTEHGMRVFSLPVNIEAMHRLLILKERRGELKSGTKAVRSSREQAERVAWRIMKDWLGAQLALIESHMVDLTQVMLPYLRVDEHRTLWQSYQERELLELVVGSRD